MKPKFSVRNALKGVLVLTLILFGMAGAIIALCWLFNEFTWFRFLAGCLYALLIALIYVAVFFASGVPREEEEEPPSYDI